MSRRVESESIGQRCDELYRWMFAGQIGDERGENQEVVLRDPRVHLGGASVAPDHLLQGIHHLELHDLGRVDELGISVPSIDGFSHFGEGSHQNP